MVSFAALGTVDSRTDVLPPGGSVHQETNVDLNASLAPGWARATCSGPVKASLLFRRRNSEGAPTAEAGVNAAAVPATRFVTFAEQGEGQFGTGVAYANPSATAALVTFTARDAAGEVLPSVNRTLSPGGHAAHGMSELFDLTSFTGSIEVTSTEPIVSLSLNFEADPVFSSLPPGETPAGEIPASDVPDLVVQTPSVSDSSPNAGESFTLSATVRNQGSGLSASTTLRYYRSSDATITTGDTEVGTDTVGSLTAAASSDQSISLTAPSTAGTYYYGACVDPVSGESATGNNCSSAVRVTVSDSRTEVESFDLDAGNDFPQGITFANDRFYVVDYPSHEDPAKVYAYHATGQRDSASDFDLDADNDSPLGIVFANDRFYVVDGADKVYAYHATGQRDSASDFDLDPDNDYPPGITFANGRFFVVDQRDYKVYAYHATGQRDSASDFDLDPNNNWPRGIAFANDRFFVLDRPDGTVYAYHATGQRDSASDFDLDPNNNWPQGITVANNRFFVVDGADDKVYVYPDPEQGPGRPDRPDLVVQTPSISDSSPNAGEAFTFSATVRNLGVGSSAATTLRYYRSSNETISTRDTPVGTDAVGGLAASAASGESISLTAPSSAGTYYYGACVDPVSGEYATRNNCSRAVTVTVASSTGDPWSRPNIERFRGTWQFTYTRNGAAITDTFVLSIIIEQSDEPGEWLIGGIQDDGVVAVLLYSRVSDSYVLATAAAVTPDEIEELYSFNLTSPTTVSGCYYEILSSTSLSSCYPMTGVKTSSSTLSSLQRAQPNTTAAQPELDSKIIRVLEDLQEDLREVLRQ